MTVDTQWPTISVVMPIRNEADFIARSLGAVLNQDYPAEKIEVLIADGMSDDDTVAIIQQMQGADRVRVIPNPERIQAYGLNHIIPQATGDYIVRVDGHTIIAPDYVRQCVMRLQSTGASNVGGAMDPVGITPSGRAISAAGKSPFAVPSVFHVSKTPQYTDTVYLGAWPRHIFEEVGLFSVDVGVNEDYEMNYRIRAHGGQIYFDPAIQSTYYSRQTWRHLMRQYYRYGRSKVQTLRKHPKSLKPRQIVAPLFVAGLIGGIPIGLLIPPLALIWVSVVALYITLGLIFAQRAAKANPDPVAASQVLLAFAIMHIAWGLGFWRELIFPAPL